MARGSTGSGGVRARAGARVRRWTRRRSHTVGGHNPWELALEVGQAAARHRLTGVAAEMAFFAVLALVPLTLAFGSALGYVGRFLGPQAIIDGRDATITVMTTLIGPELTVDTVAPFVRDLLTREEGGFAFGSLLVAAWLGSRMFTPALHAVGIAHGAEEHRSALRQRLVGLGMAAGSLAASVLTLSIMLVGPLLGSGRGLAQRMGLGGAFQAVWAVGRWVVLLALLTGILTWFYRWAPNRSVRWRDSLPGALVGLVLWLLTAFGFRLYLATGGRAGGTAITGVAAGEELIATVAGAVGAVFATMLWAFLSSLAILIGGEVNGALVRRRATPPPEDAMGGSR